MFQYYVVHVGGCFNYKCKCLCLNACVCGCRISTCVCNVAVICDSYLCLIYVMCAEIVT